MDLLATHPVKKSDLGFHGNYLAASYSPGSMQPLPPMLWKK